MGHDVNWPESLIYEQPDKIGDQKNLFRKAELSGEEGGVVDQRCRQFRGIRYHLNRRRGGVEKSRGGGKDALGAKVTSLPPIVYLDTDTSTGLVPSSIHNRLSAKGRVTPAASFMAPMMRTSTSHMMVSTHSMMASCAAPVE